MKRISSLILTIFLLFLSNHSHANAISQVSISPPTFNPSGNQKIKIELNLESDGVLTARILDRDGVPVRLLCESRKVTAGKIALEFDGKDETGSIVPDEAYSIHAVLQAKGKTHIYFPANLPVQPFPLRAANYDRGSAILSYKLDQPARIHLLAASSKIDPKTNHIDGPMLRTVVNREPRIAGAIVEAWNGFDQSGTIYIPDQPNFVLSIAASPLPENAIITWGNTKKKFIETLPDRKGQSLITYKPKTYDDHQGLTSIQDYSPGLTLKAINAKWNDVEKHWVSSDGKLEITCSVEGPSAAEFLKQPGKLKAYINGKKILETGFSAAEKNLLLEIPEQAVPQGFGSVNVARSEHVIAINMVSDYGPIALNAFRVRINKENRAANTK